MEKLELKNERDNVIALMNEVISDASRIYQFVPEGGNILVVNEKTNIVDNFFMIIEVILKNTFGDNNTFYSAHIADGLMLTNGNVSLTVDKKYTPIKEYNDSEKEKEVIPSTL